MALRKCACIDTLYTELDWLDRFQAAKNDGFEAVEFWDWRIRDLDATREAAEKAGIAISGFNGDADYSLVDPTHKQKYLDYLKQSIAAAKKVGAASVTIHSNALGDGGIVVNHYDNLSHTVKLCSMYDTLLACAELAEGGDQSQSRGAEHHHRPRRQLPRNHPDGRRDRSPDRLPASQAAV